MTARPAVVLFDADGVLQRPGGAWRAELARFAGSHDPGALESFLVDLWVAEAPTLTGAADFADTIAPVLATWGVRTPVATVLALWHDIMVDPEMMEAVRALTAAGTRCGLATNQHAQRAAYMRESLGYERVFAPQFYSCEVGLAKPDLAFFAYAVEQLGCAAGEVLFVDDRPNNVNGARAAGLRAEVFSQYGGAAELKRILHDHGWA